jgi:hypothetical protein
VPASSDRPKRQRGSIDELPSGARRVRVYAGIDPISKRRLYLTEIIPSGAKVWHLADQARRRLVSQVDERRNPRTSATVSQLLKRFLDQFNGDRTTLTTYRRYVQKHVEPLIAKRRSAAFTPTYLTPSTRNCAAAASKRPAPVIAFVLALGSMVDSTAPAAVARVQTPRSIKHPADPLYS